MYPFSYSCAHMFLVLWCVDVCVVVLIVGVFYYAVNQSKGMIASSRMKTANNTEINTKGLKKTNSTANSKHA